MRHCALPRIPCGWVVPGIALLATALILNWELGLVMLACVPFIGISVASLSLLMSSSSAEGTDFYGKAGGVATEVRVVSCRVVLCPWRAEQRLPPL